MSEQSNSRLVSRSVTFEAVADTEGLLPLNDINCCFYWFEISSLSEGEEFALHWHNATSIYGSTSHILDFGMINEPTNIINIQDTDLVHQMRISLRRKIINDKLIPLYTVHGEHIPTGDPLFLKGVGDFSFTPAQTYTIKMKFFNVEIKVHDYETGQDINIAKYAFCQCNRFTEILP